MYIPFIYQRRPRWRISISIGPEILSRREVRGHVWSVLEEAAMTDGAIGRLDVARLELEPEAREGKFVRLAPAVHHDRTAARRPGPA